MHRALSTSPFNSNTSSSSSSSSQNHTPRARFGSQRVELTRSVLLPSTPARQVSEVFDSIGNLDPIKYSPPDRGDCSIMPNPHITYSSVAQLNPYDSDRNTTMRDFYEVQATMASKKGVEKVSFTDPKKLPALPHSSSEGNIAFRSGLAPASTNQFNHTYLNHNVNPFRLSDETTTASSSPSRGRSLNRTPSPSKQLEDIKEDQSPDSPRSPVKRSRSPMKQMFGENGWLGRSMSMKELPSDEYRKTGLKSWGGKIKQRVEHLTENVSKAVPHSANFQEGPSRSRSASKTKFYVSLSPPMQAKLYSEIELMICATANQYLNVQHHEGRMAVDTLAKTVQSWASKNRPQVIEFMFDQATQRDLVVYNIKTFRFYGPQAESILSMNAMMQSWKNLAREMSVRTFCTPDSVIRKHLHDAYRVLEMLGAPLVTFLAFQDIQIKALNIMKDEQKRKDEYEAIEFGVERRWEPPRRKAGGEGYEEVENPFA